MKGNKIKKKWLLLLIPLILLLLGIGYCAKSTVSSGELSRRLKAEGTDTIQLDGDIKVDEPLVVNGTKTITGNGKIILTDELDGKFPDGKKKNSSWGMGCTKLDIEDTDAMAAVLNVSDGATITINGSAKVDAANKANAIHVADGGKLIVDGKATVENGRYANIAVSKKAEMEIKKGSVLNAKVYGIINAGTLEINGGTLSGATTGAVLYNTGKATQSSGTIEKAGVHNVYVAEGTFTMTGGTNGNATKDGVIVQKDATAEIKGGEISNCVHGLCNNGKMTAETITLKESGIMNYKPGVLELNKVAVDTAAVYCLANNGGKVIAKNFTAKKCDTCAIYNFSGDMELIDVTVTGSRDGNIANGGGNLTVKGGKLEKCRDKSIVVGNGKAVFEDVTIAGTSREKYGVYVYGGEFYITNAEVYDISSTAFKVDTGGYIEAKDINMKDIAQIGFRADGGKVVAENVTMKDLGSHAIYNMEGDITITGAKIDTIAKNAIQQRGGNTTLKDVEVDHIGNHAAYIALGKVTVTDSAFKNMEGNGFYLIEGDNEAILKNVVLDGVKKQGINNQSKMTIDGLTVKNVVQNGIFNKEKGTIVAKNVEISKVGEHGVNNYNTMTLTDAKISDTGKGSNGLQNKGTLTIKEVSTINSKNHGVYNTGTLKGSDLTVKNAAKNGVYNNKGTFNVAKVAVNGAGEHGLNNAASMTVSEVTVKDTGKGKNSVQNSGTLSISTAALMGSKNHGIYNTGTVTGKNVTVENVAENGIYNAKGKIDAIDGLAINKTGSHGINNEAVMVVSNLDVKNTGTEKNNIQNAGTLTVKTATLLGSKNHGIYNTGILSGKNITIEIPTGNGVYNNGGTVNEVSGLTIKNAGDQGINNNGKFTASNIVIDKTAKNGIYNNGGTLTADGVAISNTGEHGVSNEGTMAVSNTNISATGVGKNGIQNKGTLTTSGVKVDGSKNHGIYNAGTLTAKGDTKITNSKVNAVYNYQGKFTSEAITVEATGEHGVNNAATLEIAELTVTSAGQNAIQNSGDIRVSKGAVLKNSGKHGIYNGNTFYGENISINSAGDLALSNSGEMEVHGLETAGTAHKAIYNSGYAELYAATIDGTSVANAGAEYLVDNNGGVLDLTDTTIRNAKGTALHNRGKAATSVTNVVINSAGNYGTFVESGSSLAGDGLEINNITKGINEAEGIPIKNAGKITMLDHVTIGEDDPEVTGSAGEVNTTLESVVNNAIVNDATTASYSGYDLVINNATGGCAVYNKGILYVTDFSADKAKDGIVSRYAGWATLSGSIVLTNTSRNPIVTYGPESNSYNNGIELTSGSTMTIDGTASHGINNRGSFLAAADTNLIVRNVIGTNVNAINNNAGTMTLGNVTVDNVRVAVSMYNSTTINTNSGNAIQTSGPLTVNGEVVISNIYTKPANNKKDNSNGSGVVVKNGGSISGSGSITINGNGNDGDYSGLYNGIFTTKCAIDIAGDIKVHTTSNQGIYVADANASVKAANITIENAGLNALWINNASGMVRAVGTIKTASPAKGRGINNAGVVEAGNIEISDVTNYAGIENSSKITVTGDVKVENVTNGVGIRNKGTMTVNGMTTIKDISGTNTNGIQQDGGKTMNLNNLVISNVSSTTADSNYGNGIYTKGTIRATDVQVKNIKNIGIFMEGGAVLKADTVMVDDTENQAVQLNHANTLTVGTMTLTNTPKNGLRLYNNNANPTVTIGTLITKNCTEYGVAAQKAITNSNLNITLLQYFNCGASKNNQVVHSNIKSGIGSQEALME